ncbi:hypothetical protein V9T40_004479 [Parthenolecanium corni]|uniref:Uncharacterized protein n=1 Tax=Parthenolecanium corni TaxID=536013 RepID=A0AAN9Y9L6_9HEMI
MGGAGTTAGTRRAHDGAENMKKKTPTIIREPTVEQQTSDARNREENSARAITWQKRFPPPLVVHPTKRLASQLAANRSAGVHSAQPMADRRGANFVLVLDVGMPFFFSSLFSRSSFLIRYMLSASASRPTQNSEPATASVERDIGVTCRRHA